MNVGQMRTIPESMHKSQGFPLVPSDAEEEAHSFGSGPDFHPAAFCVACPRQVNALSGCVCIESTGMAVVMKFSSMSVGESCQLDS